MRDAPSLLSALQQSILPLWQTRAQKRPISMSQPADKGTEYEDPRRLSKWWKLTRKALCSTMPRRLGTISSISLHSLQTEVMNPRAICRKAIDKVSVPRDFKKLFLCGRKASLAQFGFGFSCDEEGKLFITQGANAANPDYFRPTLTPLLTFDVWGMPITSITRTVVPMPWINCGISSDWDNSWRQILTNCFIIKGFYIIGIST